MAHALPFLDFPGPIAFSHRGEGPKSEENTLESFGRAVDLGYGYIETDVQGTRDGVPVLFHDDDLSRILGQRGKIPALDWSDIASLRTACGAAPARLDQALHQFPEIRFNLDAKTQSAIDPMAAAISAAGAENRVCIGSFNVRRTLGVIRQLDRPVAWSPSHFGTARAVSGSLGLPVGRPPFAALQIPVRFGPIPLVTPRLMRWARSRGIHVHVWTINEPNEMHRLLDLGVDGLMTDRGAVLKEVLQDRGAWTRRQSV